MIHYYRVDNRPPTPYEHQLRPFDETALDKAIRLQSSLIAFSTGGGFDGENPEYQELRRFFVARGDTKTKLPDCVRRCRDLGQFWGWIKFERGTYAERRTLLWDAFRPLIEHLESGNAPGLSQISDTLDAFDAEHVRAAWQKALDRRVADPEGAITAARSLLETVCKHILDDAGAPYPADADLPKLWALVAQQLNLAPQQHEEGVFKAILGNSQAVVNNLAAIRNRIGDAHGHGRRPVKPKPRHAELAVNLAGTMAAFLVATWLERNDLGEPRDQR
ncbi:MAG: abortive infection family protein [Alphaproteobacteria bacterium]|nr:abortive infection family protein [Alphaproteobacteria bacterium]